MRQRDDEITFRQATTGWPKGASARRTELSLAARRRRPTPQKTLLVGGQSPQIPHCSQTIEITRTMLLVSLLQAQRKPRSRSDRFEDGRHGFELLQRNVAVEVPIAARKFVRWH